MHIFITGGAGYIGSHVVLEALNRGYDVTVYDDLSTGNKGNIFPQSTFILGSIFSYKTLSKVMNGNQFDAVIHLAASKDSGESMLNPIKYCDNNIIGGYNLLKSCINYNIKNFIFSSSASVYGNPKYNPVDELHPLEPLSFYGYTKLSIEQCLKWYSDIYGLKYASLRYFNAAGYDVEGKVEFFDSNSRNLIPVVLETAKKRRPYVSIFGNQYNTSDGTGVRDFIHVTDLAKAHIDALEHIKTQNKNLTINLGFGKGLLGFRSNC